ncbi:Aste57867_277 [Aphanomyces stellatus]|uniref:Aste57867_277 protein n=1 Tax=Aphanomyces stellatus TaxID=120398 RepID=A0A485K5A3_9STRA|nr:hypothetical protein As57867_000277 [Aphanomyces stellatus]VFT77503.1 Aste57867_277 [Aphanomyces stellatus]
MRKFVQFWVEYTRCHAAVSFSKHHPTAQANMIQTSMSTPPIMREKRRLDTYTTAAGPVKRCRSFTEFDYEEMLCTVATMVEDLNLLLDVVADICADKHCRCCNPISISSLRLKLTNIQVTITDNDSCTLQTVQAMCVDIFAVMKYLMGPHYADAVALGLGHLVVGARNQFAQFMMQYSLN